MNTVIGPHSLREEVENTVSVEGTVAGKEAIYTTVNSIFRYYGKNECWRTVGNLCTILL